MTIDVDDLDMKTGGEALHEMLSSVNVNSQLESLKKEVLLVKSVSKRDAMVRKIKYLAGLQKMDKTPQDAYTLHYMPVIPPIARPTIAKPGNRIEYADVNTLYKDHMLANEALAKQKEDLSDDGLKDERKALYDGAKAVLGVGDAITGSSRGRELKGFMKQIGGDGGPKTGFFQSKILSKKQDFSGRATIYAEPNLGFNEIACPEDMIWTMYEFHIIRDLVKSGYQYPEAKKAVEDRNSAAQASFTKLIKQIPIIANRAPTLMQSNITAHYPVPIKGKTLGINPIHLPMYAGDFDGDALTVHVPITPEAIDEARKKLLPEHHIYDFRKGLGESLIAPGHEAIIGSMHLTEPDMTQEVKEFSSEKEVLAALEAGTITTNTPIRLTGN
jgi:DNA-directed RNA polymerase beta' subunit